MPGKSVRQPCLLASTPTFFSTVTPAQFPTYSYDLVKALNKDVFPVFGFPIKPISFIGALPQCGTLLYDESQQPVHSIQSYTALRMAYCFAAISCFLP